MATIYTRAAKGSALTWTEGDANITNLNNELVTKVASVSAGTGISVGGTATAPSVALANTTVSAGSYTYASITVDAQGRITSASNGTTPLVSGGALGTPSSGTVTNLTGTASININGTVGATTPNTGAFTTVSASTTGTNGAINVTYTPATASGAAIQTTGKDSQGGTGFFDFLKVTNTTTGATNANKTFRTNSTGGLEIVNNAYNSIILSLTDAGVLSANLSGSTVDGTNLVGYRSIPSAGAEKTGSYTLTTSDRAEFVQVGSGGSITVPNSTFAAGDVVVIYNNHTAAITITLSTSNAYVAGTNTNRTSVSLATRGVCNILFISSTVAILTGNIT